MATQGPFPIPWPLTTIPGQNPQESGGRLINCRAEPGGDPQQQTSPSRTLYVRQPGLSLQATTTEVVAYRGGLIVNNLSYEVWANAYTVTSAGIVSLLGALPGTKKVSIARDQNASPHVVAVDIDNGAYVLSGGGAPASYNGGGNLPQPNSICFQDGYFFYTIGDGRCFASPINSIGTINALTFITCQSKSDVTLFRGIAYAGVLWLFNSGGCEIWQDQANVAPAFPYGRLLVIEYGLVQPNAIAGWETGFSELLWVAQDFGVYWCTPGSTQPIKVSPRDLERLIEVQIRAGNNLEAGVYAFAGRKFWVLSSPAWSWEFCITTRKWNERWSQSNATGLFGRWRGTCGHPAFGKWLIGDQQNGNLLWVDQANYTENNTPMLFRLESGPVNDFPQHTRIARADFDFNMGVGNVQGAVTTIVLGATAGTNGVVRLQVLQTLGFFNGDAAVVAAITGTTEANGIWTPITVIDATHIEIPVQFQHAYIAGGTVGDLTAPPNQINPQVQLSVSKDGGITWGNPLLRSLGRQQRTKGVRASVKQMGQTGPQGARWRMDITDPVYVGFLKATMSSNPREVGA